MAGAIALIASVKIHARVVSSESDSLPKAMGATPSTLITSVDLLVLRNFESLFRDRNARCPIATVDDVEFEERTRGVDEAGGSSVDGAIEAVVKQSLCLAINPLLLLNNLNLLAMITHTNSVK